MTGELFPIPPPDLDDMIACAKRELEMRRRVYPRWINSRKMSEHHANREISVMEAILERLRRDKQEGRE